MYDKFDSVTKLCQNECFRENVWFRVQSLRGRIVLLFADSMSLSRK